MTNKIRGGAFRLTGLILGIVGATVSLTAIVFSTIGLHQHTCARPVKKEKNSNEIHQGGNPFQS